MELKVIEKHREFILAQHPPMRRTLITDCGKFFVSLPYVIYFWNGELNVGFSKKECKNNDTKIRATGLPNIDCETGNVCMGDVRHRVKVDLHSFLTVISKFWASEFTLNDGEEWDGPDVVYYHFRKRKCEQYWPNGERPEGYGNGYKAWENASRKDPEYGLKIKWPVLEEKLTWGDV